MTLCIADQRRRIVHQPRRRNTCKGIITMMSTHQRDCIILLCLVVVVCIQDVESQAQCTPLIGSTKKCSCTYTDGSTTRVFDFTRLGNDNGQAAFPYTDVAGTDYKYAYNPCFPFSDAFCQNTAACQVSTNEAFKFPIGDPASVTYTVENSDIVITYGAVDGRISVVNFHCDTSALKAAKYTPQGEQGTEYKFTIGTCLACLNDVPNCYTGAGGGGGGSLTGGGIICIIFTVLLVVYIVGGILFQKFHRGATGKEVIPNYGFWVDFPILVKDGFMFLIGLCRGGSSASDYESIK